MDENIKRIGKHANKIKEIMSNSSSLNAEEIMSKKDFDVDEFYLGLGWLSNEHEEINLEQLTGINDLDETKYIISKLLKNKSKKNVATIAKHAHLTSKEVYVALGSFAQQNKLVIFDGKTLQTKYSLK